jgi:t-SNARE complex subunit (syntaxin)
MRILGLIGFPNTTHVFLSARKARKADLKKGFQHLVVVVVVVVLVVVCTRVKKSFQAAERDSV